MSTGYTRQSAAEIIPSAVVKSSSFNNELNKIRDAFKFSTDGGTGHTHDGSSDEGSYVPLIADTDGRNRVVVDASANRISFYNEVSSSPIEQVRFEDGVVYPVTDNDVDLGTSSLKFKTIYTKNLSLENGFSEDLDMGGFRIKSLGSPTSANDAVNLQYLTETLTSDAPSFRPITWQSEGTYTTGSVVWSPVNYFAYESLTDHSGLTTDPSEDAVNWTLASGELATIEQPVNVTPANASTVSVSGPTLTGSTFYSLYGKTKAAGQWQVSTAADFSTTVVDTGDVSGTAVTYTVPIQTLSESTTYYWRCRYKDVDGAYSAWSDGTSFTTSVLFTPSAEVAKIVASDAAANDEFGRAVAIDGDYVVVGVPDEGGQGAVYVYERDGSGSWSQMQKFTSSDIQSGDEFGQSVAIDGDYIVVGAPMEDTGGTSAGAVYVFELSGGTWSQMQKIQPSDISAGDQAGSSVAIDGTTLVFGSLQKDSQRGGAYVYDLSGGTWSETAILEASDRQASDQFGINVDISGNYIIVATHEEDTTASAAGSCYFFELDGTWSEMQKVQASDVAANRRIGQNGVAIDGNYAAITNGVDDQVYIFQLSGGTWSEVEIVTPGGALDSSGFAASVALDEPFLVVGATLAHSETTADVGAVYVYQHDGAGTWTQVARFTASDEALNDQFGFSVGIFENRVVIGARYEDAGGTDSGAAYIFE